MKSFEYHNPVTAIMGDDALEKLAELTRDKRVLLVLGASSARKSGNYDMVRAKLDEARSIVRIFEGISQCTYDRIVEGADLARSENTQMVIGLGGASVMDTAKAIAFCAVHDNYDDYLEGSKEQRNEEKLPLILIPTYPSTGSEANGVSDIMGYAGGIHGVFADYALLCPKLTYSLDKRNTAFSTMVMLAQTGYRYFTDENPISRGFTAASLRAILASNEVLMDDLENHDARANMLWASFIETSGLLGLCMVGNWTYSIFSAAGLLRFTLGTVYRENLAMVYPRWLVFAASHHPEEVHRFLVDIFGVDADMPEKEALRVVYDRLLGILKDGGLPTTLDAYGELPDKDALKAAVSKVSSKEFSLEEYSEMIAACTSEAFPG